MIALLEIREKLQDTHAAMARLRQALSSTPDDEGVALMAESLVRRQEYLEVAFRGAADTEHLDICNYRLIPEADGNDYPLLGVSKILGEFQELVTTVFDAIKTKKPKSRARIGPEIVQLSTFDFGYVVPGSLEIVLTIPNERLMLIESDLDETMEKVFALMKSSDAREIGEIANTVGIASIKKLYELSEDHKNYALSADIRWRRNAEVRSEVVVQPKEFERLCATLREKSAEEREELSLKGRLVGLDVDLGTFHMAFAEGDDIKGKLGSDYKDGSPAEVPGNYTAKLIKTTVIHYSTQEDKITFELLKLA